MVTCAGCSATVSEDTVVCPGCGAALGSTVPTVVQGLGPADLAPAGRRESGALRFATGTVLASRYRIVTALGHGGMSEVYRADDLKLNQPVALKCLPAARAADAAAQERLRGEVRLARQISHPNVCRVFDLVEIQGQSFLCMEYIDGEDLESLLRRIGRLPVDKAMEIAGQLAAGLAAIHDGGLLHRDLKPANVMIDGRGRARITDFGVAIPAGESEGRRAGTRAYMAPEQRSGGKVSVQSDLYSLGLVLYEMFTGRPARSLTAGTELPMAPSRIDDRIDPRTDAVVLRCLDSDPGMRPASALQVSAALSGLDTLSAAVAEGIILSPDAVAAAPRVGSLRPAVAIALLAATFAGLATLLSLSGQVLAFRQVPLEQPPEVLAGRARSLLHQLGYTRPPHDWDFGLLLEPGANRYLTRLPDSSRVTRQQILARGRPPLYLFWYRESPGRLLPTHNLGVTPDDPPRSAAGDVYVALDPEGHLDRLAIVPALPSPAADLSSEPRWGALLTAAGLDPMRLKTAAPALVPPVYADHRAAWEGTDPGTPGAPGLSFHVEAASFRGAPVWFSIQGPWSLYPGPAPAPEGAATRIGRAFVLALKLTLTFTAVWLARRNLQLGRADKRGAVRLAVVVLAFDVLYRALKEKHLLVRLVGNISDAGLAEEIYKGIVLWTLYLAFEPSVRRLWPERIVAWNRLLAGKLRDPLVGRDVVVGCLLGCYSALARYLGELSTGRLATWLDLETLCGGLSGSIRSLLLEGWDSVTASMEFMVLLLGFRVFLRRDGAAIGVLWMVTVLAYLGSPPWEILRLVAVLLGAGLLVLSWVRFGPLAGAVCYLTSYLCLHYPLTLDTSAWYFGSALFAVLLIVALAVYGFSLTVAGQRWFAAGLDDRTPAF